MPLDRVDPVLQVEQVVERLRRIGIFDGTVHVVRAVVVVDRTVENSVGVWGEHISVGLDMVISSDCYTFVGPNSKQR